MGENFAFFLPIMMASFGIAFLIFSTWRLPTAGWWSAGFFCIGGGFSVPAGFAAFPSPLWGLLADLLFATGFLLFSQALLARWRPSWLFQARLAIWGLSLSLSVVGMRLDMMALELVASDFGCFLLIAIPLIAAKDHLHTGGDRALFGAATLVALDNFIRGSTVPFTFSGNGNFIDSDYAFLMQALACVFGLFLALSALAIQVADLLARYQREAMIDPLSGLLNRRGFDDAISRLDTRGHEGSAILCDIDHFKTVNDEFGHAFGDRVIALLAQILREIAPPNGVIARFGGEEFVMLLPGANATRGVEIAERLRERFTRACASQLGISRPLTASFGLSPLLPSDGSAHDAIARADHALYEAKARGRNRVSIRRALTPPEGGLTVTSLRAMNG